MNISSRKCNLILELKEHLVDWRHAWHFANLALKYTMWQMLLVANCVTAGIIAMKSQILEWVVACARVKLEKWVHIGLVIEKADLDNLFYDYPFFLDDYI